MRVRVQHNLWTAITLALVGGLGSAGAAGEAEVPQWKPHSIKQGDGHGGWVLRAGELQFLRKPGGQYTMPFGLVPMDNGEILLIGSWHEGKNEPGVCPEVPMVAFSRDKGNTWTEFTAIPDARGRPMMLTVLGNGKLVFQTDLVNPVLQYFSDD